MTPLVPGIIAIALYLTGGALQLAGIARGRLPASNRVRALGFAATALHAVVAWQLVAGGGGVDLGFFHAASLFSLIMVVLPLLASFWRPTNALLIVLFPLAALALASALTLHAPGEPLPALPPGLLAHIALSVLAYATLTLAACQAVLLAWQEHRLRSHAALGSLQVLPPLQTMEAFLFELLWIGIALLTLAIASGMAFLEDMFEQQVVHHTVLSLTSWAVFAALLWGRHRLGWRGPTATRWTLGGFVLLMLAYFGSKLVLELILAD